MYVGIVGLKYKTSRFREVFMCLYIFWKWYRSLCEDMLHLFSKKGGMPWHVSGYFLGGVGTMSARVRSVSLSPYFGNEFLGGSSPGTRSELLLLARNLPRVHRTTLGWLDQRHRDVLWQ